MGNHKTDELNIYYYSERGLIIYFLECFLSLNKNEKRKVLKNLITKINKKIMVDKLKWFNLVVEPSFGQYGDPDLLILSSTGQGGKYYCIFIEAKRDPFDKAIKQKNSSNIICQLINKMKVAESKIKIYGKNQLSIEYHNEDNNEDKKLKNDESLKILDLIISSDNKNTHSNKLKKNTEFYYVTLTNDKDSVGIDTFHNIDEFFEKLPSFMSDETLYKNVYDNNIGSVKKTRISSITSELLTSRNQPDTNS